MTTTAVSRYSVKSCPDCGPNSPIPALHATGIYRPWPSGSSTSLTIIFDKVPTDEQMRRIHDLLSEVS